MKSHASSILRKLRLRDRTHAVAYGVRMPWAAMTILIGEEVVPPRRCQT